MRKIALFVLVLMAPIAVIPLRADDQITYISQPDEVYIFLNNIAFARDNITLPAGVNAKVTLPASIIDNTLVVREDDKRVSQYRIEGVDVRSLQAQASHSQRDVFHTVMGAFAMHSDAYLAEYDIFSRRFSDR